MDKIFTSIAAWLRRLAEVETPADPLAGLTLAELADLPPVHPQED